MIPFFGVKIVTTFLLWFLASKLLLRLNLILLLDTKIQSLNMMRLLVFFQDTVQ